MHYHGQHSCIGQLAFQILLILITIPIDFSSLSVTLHSSSLNSTCVDVSHPFENVDGDEYHESSPAMELKISDCDKDENEVDLAQLNMMQILCVETQSLQLHQSQSSSRGLDMATSKTTHPQHNGKAHLAAEMLTARLFWTIRSFLVREIITTRWNRQGEKHCQIATRNIQGVHDVLYAVLVAAILKKHTAVMRRAMLIIVNLIQVHCRDRQKEAIHKHKSIGRSQCWSMPQNL